MHSNEYKTDKQKKSFYNSSAWRKLRLRALERDNYECQWCKREGKVTVDSIKEDGKRKEIVLNVDHKYPIEHYPKLALTLDNLETLCVYHHNVKEGRTIDKMSKHKSKKKRWGDERW
ncbi:HNH endonuclease [Virgibacillus pantothenticus]|uniref:HNH endonuclease n=1 Tax=Virgibacillus pantothenticus TaxID=1473 RepID=UPI001B1592CA|nr:HNH endonuclease [Virgibacillus pantothenticus]GIP63354.1 HNH endonuclease [Virgibacillus pantothenticus]